MPFSSLTPEQLSAHLTGRLAGPLPGAPAQQRMASTIRAALGLPLHPDHRTRTGAVCLLLYWKLGGWHLPLIVRPDYDGVHSGQVALPGGRMEPADASVAAAALRETHEEIGVPPGGIVVAGLLTPVFVPASQFLVHPVVAIASAPPVFTPDPREVARILEIPVAHLFDQTLQSETDISVRGVRLRVPCFMLAGHTVWGATAMMLSEFAAVL